MPLTSPPTWVLLGLICTYLIIGNADVNAGEEMQLREEAQDGEPLRLAKTPRNTRRVLKLPDSFWDLLPKNYSFPIESKGGVLYYDLAGANDTEVEIYKNNQSVTGITASSGKCKVQFLYLRITYLLDEELFTHCPLLNLKLKGDKWSCVQVGRMLQQQGVTVDMKLAKCGDAWNDNKTEKKDLALKYWMTEGIQKLEEFNITKCSAERCFCKWYFKGDAYTVNVDCEGVGLKDDTLPVLPSHVKTVLLKRNALRSMDKLIQHLLPHNQTIEVILANDNQMQELPRLPPGTFPRITVISLVRNRIEKIDVDVFEELVARKNFSIHLEHNPLRCDCLMYRFKDFLHHQCMKDSNVCRHSYTGLKCKYEDENKTIPVHEVSEEGCNGLDWSQVDWWLVFNICLGVSNLFMIYLMIDLICILAHIRGNNERRPRLDLVVCALKRAVCFLCWRSSGTVDED